MPPRRKRDESKPYNLPGGAPPPSWANINQDNRLLQGKLDRIAKIIANESAADAAELIRAICEEDLRDSIRGDEAGSG